MSATGRTVGGECRDHESGPGRRRFSVSDRRGFCVDVGGEVPVGCDEPDPDPDDRLGIVERLQDVARSDVTPAAGSVVNQAVRWEPFTETSLSLFGRIQTLSRLHRRRS